MSRRLRSNRRCVSLMPRCDWVAERAFERQLANSYALQKLYYYEVRETFNLPADIAILTFKQVASCYKRDKSKQVSFRPLAAIPIVRVRFVTKDWSTSTSRRRTAFVTTSRW